MNTLRKEILYKMHVICEQEQRKKAWWTWNHSYISFGETRLLEDYEKDANLRLPENIFFPKGSALVRIDKLGVLAGKLYAWQNILITAFRIERQNKKYAKDYYYLMLGLTDGKIVQIDLGITDHLFGLTGHFIEQYKTLSRSHLLYTDEN